MEEKIGVYIGKRVLELREHRGLTQKELAAAAGVPQPHISQLERGLFTDIQVTTLLNLAHALGVKHTTLLPESALRSRPRRKRPAKGAATDDAADPTPATLDQVLTQLRPTYQEVLGQIAIGQTTGHAPAILKGLVQLGLIEPHDEPHRDRLGAYTVTRYEMPIHVRIAWCAWCAAHPEPEPCRYCGQSDRWHARDCERPLPPDAPCAWCALNGKPGTPAILKRWGEALCQDCADDGDEVFAPGSPFALVVATKEDR